MGACDASDDAAEPAKFYLLSAPAHKEIPARLVRIGDAKRLDLGSQATSNERSIFQFVHPDVMESCQLVVGMTMLAEGSVWNTMPCHVHDRRSEAYLYFDLPDDARACDGSELLVAAGDKGVRQKPRRFVPAFRRADH